MGLRGQTRRGEAKRGENFQLYESVSHRPSSGWFVEIDHPTSGNTLRPTVLSGVQRNPRANGLPHVSIPVPKADKWHSTDLKGAAMRVWHDGVRQPIDEVARVEQGSGRSVIVGVGGVELLDEVSTDVVSELAWVVGRDLVQNNTGYAANFDDPGGTATESLQQDADTTSEWSDVIGPSGSDAFEAANGNLESLQPLFFSEGENPTDSNGAGLNQEGEDYSGDGVTDGFGEAARLSETYVSSPESGDFVEYEFTIGHTIPESAVGVAIRQAANEFPSLEWSLNGQVIDSVSHTGGGISLGWDDVGDGQFDGSGWSGGDLSQGTHTVRVEVTNGQSDIDVWLDVDCVTLYDKGGTRFTPNYTFDNTVEDGTDGGRYLQGPELHPDQTPVPLATVEIIGNAVAARIASTWDDTTGSQQLEVSNDGGVTYPLSVSNSATLDQDFADNGAQLKARLTLSRYGSRDNGTPLSGFNGQVVNDFELYADIEDSAVISNTGYNRRLVDVLRQIADYSDSVFEVRIDSGGSYSVEWTRPGVRTTDLPADAIDYTLSEDTEQVVEQATVYGAANDVEGETFTADVGNEVALANSPIIAGTDVVYDDSGTMFERDADYIIRHEAGTIEATSTGSLSDSTTYNVDYRYKISATVTADGVSNPRFQRFDLTEVSTVRGCRQAAGVLVDKLKDPVVEARLVVDKQPLGWNVIDAINPDVFPTDAHLQLKDIEQTPSQAVISFESRQSINDVADELRSQFGQVARRS